jgi:hypothetical protein
MRIHNALLLALFVSSIQYSTWSYASGGCRVDKAIVVPIASATITFKDGSVRLIKGIELQYEYVYEADKRYFNPMKHRANKRELFIGLCAPNTASALNRAGKEISKITLDFEAEYSYTPHRLRLLLTDGKEFVVEGDIAYGPLVPPHDFLANKSEGIAAPEVAATRLLLVGTDAESNKAVSAVVYDASERHDPDIQISSIQVEPSM